MRPTASLTNCTRLLPCLLLAVSCCGDPAAGPDDDGDGISNVLEVKGFTYSPLHGLRLWNGRDEPHYRTDPRRWSTDGDPYSDYMEATGLNMPVGVPDPQDHPLVAARPVITAFMEGFDLIPIATTSRGTSTQEMKSSSHTTTNEDTVGGEVGVEVSSEVEMSITGPKVSGSTKVSAKASYSHTWVRTDSSEESTTSGKNESITVATDRAAKMKLRLYFENVGSAPARQVVPTCNLILGEKVIATIEPSQPAQFMNRHGRPRSRFPARGAIVIGSGPEDEIILSLQEVEALREGAAMQLEVIQVEAKAARWDEDTEQWSFDAEWVDFSEEIDEATASLLVRNGDTSSSQHWIYSGTDYEPAELSLREAVDLVLPVGEDADGAPTIMGRHPDDWFYGIPGGGEGSGAELLETRLTRHGTYLMVLPDEEPDPEIVWAEFGEGNRSVRVSVDPGDLPVTRITARLESASGEMTEVELSLDGHLYTNSEEFEPAVGGTVVVEDIRGVQVEQRIDDYSPI